MNLRQFVSDYFSFSRRERIGIVSLLVILSAVFFAPKFFPENTDTPIILSDTLVGLMPDSNGSPDKKTARTFPKTRFFRTEHRAPIVLFEFDPNTLDETGWQRLGLRTRTIATIMKFRSKGGHFRQPQDLQRVYGLFPDEFERLAPYVKIAHAASLSKRPASIPLPSRKRVIDINTADSASWLALPGIGPGFARRILNFRQKLGGFFAVEQVADTYGLPDSVFQKIRPLLQLSTPPQPSLDLNSIDYKMLSAHPCFRNHARAIIAWRTQHGPFGKQADLQQVLQIDAASLRKMQPYILNPRE